MTGPATVDKRPREAIKAAKRYIKNPNKKAAADAAQAEIKTKILRYGYKLLCQRSS